MKNPDPTTIRQALIVFEIRNYSVDLENKLKQLGAKGQGIKELTQSIQGSLNQDIIDKIRECNHLRNNVMHEGLNPSDEQFRRYKQQMEEILTFIDDIINPKISYPFSREVMIVGAVIAAILCLIVGYYIITFIMEFYAQILTIMGIIVIIYIIANRK